MEENIKFERRTTLPKIPLDDFRLARKNRVKNPQKYLDSLGKNIEGITIVEDKFLLFRRKEDKRFTISLINKKVCLGGRKKFCYLSDDNKIYTVYKDNKVKGTLVYVKTKREIQAIGTPISYTLEGIILVKHRIYFGYNMTKIIYKEGKILSEEKHLYGYGDIVKSL